MTHTQFLKKLGAPLKSTIQSWGAIRPSDEAIFLLIWQDRFQRIGDDQFVQITARGKLQSDRGLGAKERLQHIDLIKKGATCYLVVCIAKDKAAHPRKVKEFRSDCVFLGGEIIEHEGELWIRREKSIPTSELAAPTS